MESEIQFPRKRMCRKFALRRQISWKRILPHITVLDDPKKLAQLNAEVEKRRLALSKSGKQA
jgi:hypothetical protein